MRRPCRVAFVDTSTEEAYTHLRKSNDTESIFSAIERVMAILQDNAFAGIQIPKRLIPPAYSRQYSITNLWKYNLPHGWRLLYALETVDNQLTAIIIEWLAHKEYERRFKY